MIFLPMQIMQIPNAQWLIACCDKSGRVNIQLRKKLTCSRVINLQMKHFLEREILNLVSRGHIVRKGHNPVFSPGWKKLNFVFSIHFVRP